MTADFKLILPAVYVCCVIPDDHVILCYPLILERSEIASVEVLKCHELAFLISDLDISLNFSLHFYIFSKS